MTAVVIALLPAAGFGIYNFGDHCKHSPDRIVIRLALEEKNYHYRYVCGSNGTFTGTEPAGEHSAVDGGFGWCVCNSGSKNAVRWSGTEFHEPGTGSQMFPVDLFPFADDELYPLAALKAGESVNVMNMIVGKTAGTIGETSMIALLIGACFLILIGVIDLRIPGTYIVTVILFAGIFGGHGFDPAYLSAQLAGGGLILGAFFMATDYVTRPVTSKGQYVYGIVLGLLTGIFRIFGPGAEGVSYAIILGNLFVPLIEKFTMPTAFGRKAGVRREK